MLKNRQSIRLQNYDYSKPGYYFVTICIHNKKCLFGNILNNNIKHSKIGLAAKKCWKDIPKHFPNVKLDKYVIMPNHIHGIIIIINNVGVQNIKPLHKINKFQHIIPRSLGSIIRGFKIGATKWCKQNNYKDFKWQRNFYDHVIRNEKSLYNIQNYIVNNPLSWQNDIENKYFLKKQSPSEINQKIEKYYNNLFV